MSLKFSLESQLEKAIICLKKDLAFIHDEAVAGKLSAPSSRDLVAYIKLLSDLKDTQAEALSALSDEQLKKVANAPQQASSVSGAGTKT